MLSSAQQTHGFFVHAPSEQKVIKDYCKNAYPGLILELEMLEQLSWLQTNSIVTSQSHGMGKSDGVNDEVKRALTRLNCLHLLRERELSLEDRWQQFVSSQSDGIKLTEDSFSRLSQFIGSLSSSTYQCLVASCFITKSDKAQTKVPAVLLQDLPVDSEQFISYIVEKCPEILPICQTMDEPTLKLLSFAFYKNSHARHILDVEGGHNMLVALKQGIQNHSIDQDRLNLWLGRWIVNIAGLDGHVKPEGSSNLTEPMAGCIFALQEQLDQLFDNIDHPVLENYLAYRAAQLGVTNNYLASLGALMRRNTRETGEQIQAWFDLLSPEKQQEKQAFFEQQLIDTKVTPTYRPTVLLNLLNSGHTIEESIDFFSQIEVAAREAWAKAIESKAVSSNTPLSFMRIAFRENLPTVMESIKQGELCFEVDNAGRLMLAAIESPTPKP